MDYKPYTVEWSRKRYLSEAIQKYFEDNVSADVIVGDILDTLEDWALSYKNKTNKLEEVISKLK
jgi:hypothetical protein